MKPAFVPALLFLVFLLAPKASLGQFVPVRDFNGDLLIPGRKYFVMPAVPGLSGGLTVSDPGSCKTDVIQSLDPADLGFRVSFYPSNPSLPIVPESFDLNVEFSPEYFTCPASTVWMIDQASDEGYVTTGGIKENPGPGGLNSWFKIEKVNGVAGYKFKFCPTVCESCQSICMDLGISMDNGATRHLGLGKAVVNFLFLKA